MARTANENSTRQQVFATLDGMLDQPRSKAVKSIQDQYGIGNSYARTLYQSHRRDKINEGVLVETFTVRDTKDGKSIKPELVTHYKANPSTTDYTTAKKAISVYRRTLSAKLNALDKLVK